MAPPGGLRRAAQAWREGAPQAGLPESAGLLRAVCSAGRVACRGPRRVGSRGSIIGGVRSERGLL
eukprot:2975148-Alexandrium_andersonii.AAC.1